MLETLFPLGISQYAIGGLLVGTGIGMVYILTGRVAGASTVFTSTWSYFLSGSYFKEFKGSRPWRLTLSLGFILGGLAFVVFINDGQTVVSTLHPLRFLIGGILVGFGTRMAGGCASGHGICGNAFFERDSIVATITFLIVGILVALISSQIL